MCTYLCAIFVPWLVHDGTHVLFATDAIIIYVIICHTYIHNSHTYIHRYIYIYIYVCVWKYMYTHSSLSHTYIYICVYIYIYTYVHLTFVYTCMCRDSFMAAAALWSLLMPSWCRWFYVTHMYINIFLHTFMCHIYICVHIFTCIHDGGNLLIAADAIIVQVIKCHKYTYLCVYIYIYIYIWAYTYICI